jgi:hypothetical protein
VVQHHRFAFIGQLYHTDIHFRSDDTHIQGDEITYYLCYLLAGNTTPLTKVKEEVIEKAVDSNQREVERVVAEGIPLIRWKLKREISGLR